MNDEYFYSEQYCSFYKISFESNDDLITHFTIHYNGNFFFVEYVNNKFILSKRLNDNCYAFGDYDGVHNTKETMENALKCYMAKEHYNRSFLTTHNLGE